VRERVCEEKNEDGERDSGQRNSVSECVCVEVDVCQEERGKDKKKRKESLVR